MQNYRRTFIH